ncbi:MAG: Secretion system C-terminal sorting domain [Flavipsychrobacter sp.]|jgi:hypothetical protein|nr:Secretion system C-terminal sorting domain [Flavipsychrobacter sp.]
MKKSFLLFLSACFIAGAANAQQVNNSVLFQKNNDANSLAPAMANSVPSLVSPQQNNRSYGKNLRTTAPPVRWYDYVNEVLPDNILPCTGSAPVDFAWTSIDLWWDTTSLYGFNSTGISYQNTAWTSVALGFHPFSPAWNDVAKFPGEMAVRSFDAYTIDSISVAGIYGRPASYTYTDTLIVTFVNGDGGASSDMALGLVYPGSATLYCVTSVPFVTVYHDSLTNGAARSTAPIAVPLPTPAGYYGAPHVYKFLLRAADSTDIIAATVGPTGSTNMVFPRAGDPTISYAVPAGHTATASITFRSGSVGLAGGYSTTFIGATGFKDTVQYAPAISGDYAPYKYGGFSPLIKYAVTASGGTTAAFPGFVANTGPTQPDWTSGYFKRMGARGANSVNGFAANWAFTSSGGPSALQYPFVKYHVYCPTCPLVDPSLGVDEVAATNVTVTPNPAVNEVSISFNSSASATVSLTNIVGQVVAAQTVNNGVAVFNTSALPAGVYVYAVEANGERTTGRVVVAH